jgi:2-keto-4-pentenoate hydratase/2-oxohepta-3-ene-1,7-dioic acid hydratase in catechol pathway
MKVCTYKHGAATPRVGIAIEQGILDVERGLPALGASAEGYDYSSLLTILRFGPPAFDSLRRLEEAFHSGSGRLDLEDILMPADEVRLVAPIPRPNSLRDFLVFEEHLCNCMHTFAKWMFPPAAWLNTAVRRVTGRPLLRPPRAWYQFPIYYKGNADTVVGPDEPVIWPSYSTKLDYELEFGVYLWKAGKDISAKDATGHIAGFTIFNDFSARDTQFIEMAGRLGPAKGKDFDTGNVMGPYLVTPDEVGDPYALGMRAFVNGNKWSEGSSRTMKFSFEEMIAHVSRSETIYPGDFFGSGTVGSGCGLELDRWIQRGDRVTLEVDHLGRLTSPIAG